MSPEGQRIRSATTRPDRPTIRSAPLVRAGLTFGFALVIGGPGAASTAYAQSRVQPEASHELEVATQHFRQGHYPEAITLFRAAYIQSHSSFLLFNIAVAYERQGDAVQALDFYRQYAARLGLTDAEARARVDASIRRLEAVRSTTNGRAAGPPSDVVNTPGAVSRRVSPVLAAGGAVAVASAITAVVLWAVTDDEVRGYTRRCVDTTSPVMVCGADYAATQRDAGTRAIAVDVLWGATGIAAVVAAVGVILTVRGSERPTLARSAQLFLAPNRAGVLWHF